jgi:RNA polymerase-binding transcription factor DksA
MSLTEAQRQRMEKRLQEERESVLRALDRTVGGSAEESPQDRAGDLTSMPFHQADQGTDTMQEELDASNAARMTRQLAEIDAALERLYRDPEHFGICEDTGEPIPLERIEIIPWARTCEQAGR